MSRRLLWDPLLPPPLPARLPSRDAVAAALRSPPPSPEAGCARGKFSRSSWRPHGACSTAPLISPRGSAGPEGAAAWFGVWGQGPCPFPAEMLPRPKVLVTPTLSLPKSQRVSPSGCCRFSAYDKRPGGAASWRTVSVLWELGPYSASDFFSLVIPARPPVYLFPHFPFSLALLFHRWLDVTHHWAPRDLSVFLDELISRSPSCTQPLRPGVANPWAGGVW